MRNVKSWMLVFLLSYLLGVHNGYIALWQGEDPEPITIFPYRVSMLPESDQRSLKKGIKIQQESALHRLLEDYLS